MDLSAHLDQLTWTLIYAFVGMGIFGVAFFGMTRITPFSVQHEIEEDHNSALAIIIASINIGLAIVIAAAIAG